MGREWMILEKKCTKVWFLVPYRSRSYLIGRHLLHEIWSIQTKVVIKFQVSDHFCSTLCWQRTYVRKSWKSSICCMLSCSMLATSASKAPSCWLLHLRTSWPIWPWPEALFLMKRPGIILLYSLPTVMVVKSMIMMLLLVQVTAVEAHLKWVNWGGLRCLLPPPDWEEIGGILRTRILLAC